MREEWRSEFVKGYVHDMDCIQEGIEKGIEKGIEIGRGEGIEIGRGEGIEIGRNEGIEIGRIEGFEKGIKIGQINQLVELVKVGLLAIGDAARTANMTENDFAKLINK